MDTVRPLDAGEAMRRIETQLSHIWMVRTFLKHCDEAEDEEELHAIHRVLYDVPLALGAAWSKQDADTYLRQAKKKISKLRGASSTFAEIQPDVSTHTNFKMAAASLAAAVGEIERILAAVATQ